MIAQSLAFDTRLFDEAARGTEYYQLSMVPVATLLIGRGTVAATRWRSAAGSGGMDDGARADGRGRGEPHGCAGRGGGAMPRPLPTWAGTMGSR